LPSTVGVEKGFSHPKRPFIIRKARSQTNFMMTPAQRPAGKGDLSRKKKERASRENS